jgi:branched-chain amino acid transport system ATP-binding protein
MTPMLETHHLAKAFGALRATDDVSLAVLPGEVHALIGPNGAGKTTLIAQLTGELAPDAGRIVFEGRDITRQPAWRRTRLGLARSFQITNLLPRFSALDNVALAIQARSGGSFRFFAPARRDDTLRRSAHDHLARVGLAAQAEVRCADLSHGEHRQLELAVALALEPKLLLLDEPLAGMGLEDSEAMIALLQTLKGHVPMLLVEHDMAAVFSLADRISVLVYGRVIASGAPQEIRDNPQVREAYLGEEEGVPMARSESLRAEAPR